MMGKAHQRPQRKQARRTLERVHCAEQPVDRLFVGRALVEQQQVLFGLLGQVTGLFDKAQQQLAPLFAIKHHGFLSAMGQ